MTDNIYQITSYSHFLAYDFVSDGPKGKIFKGIRFSQTAIPDVWNLGFGDIDPQTGYINDTTVTDNGDTEKVLATVAQTCINFTEHYPDALIFAMGSTPARTRLYQISINRFFSEISELFIIWGLFNNSWETFDRKKNYLALLAKRK